MKRLAILAVAAAALASTFAAATATSEVPTTIHRHPVPTRCTAKAFAPFADAVWQVDLWERGRPPAATIQAQRRRLRCAPLRHRKAMRRRWRADKMIYYRYRRKELARVAYLDAITPPGPAWLAAVRECESGDDYSTATGNGFWGAYQFTASSWAAVGGSGLASEASPREQDERAAALYRLSGPGNWPVCGT